jgi:hypothetical protein
MNEKSESKKSLAIQAMRPGRWVAVVTTVAVIAAAATWFGIRSTGAEILDIVVYKTPTCVCCGNWVTHLRDHGFEVSVVNVSNTQATRERLGVPRRLGSCHTARVGKYWVEGHVPADLVKRLVTEDFDNIQGIAVPGMPAGSPGMEGPNPVTYDVLAYGSNGELTVYATRDGKRSP